MTTIATRAGQEHGARIGSLGLGLSGRLILLTILFMMLAELLIYIPAVTSFRSSWISDRLMGAQMIALALASPPGGAASSELDAKLVAAVKGAKAIGVRGPGTRWLLAVPGDAPPEPTRTIDMRISPWYGPLRGVFRTLLLPLPPVTRVIGPGAPGAPESEWVELILSEAPLREAVVAFSSRFFLVSIVISGMTSALLYLALHLIVVRPVRRLAANISEFASDPENSGRVIPTDGRSDEIGTLERAIARMETALSAELRQKRRLADLGLSVSKINHELRNMLTTAQLLGDRLGETQDPAVRRIAPRLIRTLDRAIEYCSATLAYGRANERRPVRQLVNLRAIVADQLDLTKLGDGHPITIETRVAPDLQVDADPEQLGRVLLNLMRNAVEAHARAKTPEACIVVDASRTDGVVRISVSDNGPGVPDRVKDRLFSAFQASERSGGTGLGLPVAEELVRLHGGSIVLQDGGPGAKFLITVPDRPAAKA